MPIKPPSESQPRGRPALSDGDISNMRQHISDCALRLFKQSGYHAVSIRSLAKEAKCTAMTIYRYFDRKIDILRALWVEVFDQLFDELETIIKTKSEPRERLKSAAFGYVNFWLEHREHYFLVFMSSGVSQTDVSIFIGNEQTVDRFSILRSLILNASGVQLSPQELELKSQLFLCLLNGISQNIITISAYPWEDTKTLTSAAVQAILT